MVHTAASGLQRQVWALYRKVIRLARQQSPASRAAIMQQARYELDRYRGVEKKNFQLIEHLLRKGEKQLNMLQSTNVAAVGLVMAKN